MKIKIEVEHKQLIIASFEKQLIDSMLDVYYCRLDKEDLDTIISEIKYLMKLLTKLQKSIWNFDSQTYISEISMFISMNEILYHTNKTNIY